jgi:hypothetical protein
MKKSFTKFNIYLPILLVCTYSILWGGGGYSGKATANGATGATLNRLAIQCTVHSRYVFVTYLLSALCIRIQTDPKLFASSDQDP